MFFFRSASPRQLSLGLALLRVAVATIFIRHGAQKLFVFGFAGVTGAFTHMGVPLPGFTGPFIGVLEFFGGIALLIGLLTRPIALALTFDMLVAILLVKFKGGFSGYELEFLLLGSSFALFLTGAGRFSVDGRRESSSSSTNSLASLAK
ncbi:MAG: putative oxidoreductase [Gemmatimonadaceae bacterium]|jgi:putative oxidoreductase|nr:putative oxidoreductase [Gemmatimonadaceae bacterium]